MVLKKSLNFCFFTEDGILFESRVMYLTVSRKINIVKSCFRSVLVVDVPWLRSSKTNNLTLKGPKKVLKFCFEKGGRTLIDNLGAD